MSDARIVITLDYEPNLEHYPDHVKTKRQAMEFDIESVLNGHLDHLELIDFADDVVWEVVDQPTKE